MRDIVVKGTDCLYEMVLFKVQIKHIVQKYFYTTPYLINTKVLNFPLTLFHLKN